MYMSSLRSSVTYLMFYENISGPPLDLGWELINDMLI